MGFSSNIDDVSGKRRYSRNILKWSKNDIKKKSTNGDYLRVKLNPFYKNSSELIITLPPVIDGLSLSSKSRIYNVVYYYSHVLV